MIADRTCFCLIGTSVSLIALLIAVAYRHKKIDCLVLNEKRCENKLCTKNKNRKYLSQYLLRYSDSHCLDLVLHSQSNFGKLINSVTYVFFQSDFRKSEAVHAGMYYVLL